MYYDWPWAINTKVLVITKERRQKCSRERLNAPWRSQRKKHAHHILKSQVRV